MGGPLSVTSHSPLFTAVYSILTTFTFQAQALKHYPWNACCKLYLPVSQLELFSTSLIGIGWKLPRDHPGRSETSCWRKGSLLLCVGYHFDPDLDK
ncbi:Hypothetical predicted protein [Scomber scombrus]